MKLYLLTALWEQLEKTIIRMRVWLLIFSPHSL